MWHGIVGNSLRLSLMIENGMERKVFESLNGKSKLNRELAVNVCIDDLCVPWQTAFSYSCTQYIYCSMRKILSATSWQPAHYTVLSRVRLKRLWQHTEAVLIKQAFECSQVAVRVLFGVIKTSLWWKTLSLFFKPLQTTAGMLPGGHSHHKQHICADAWRLQTYREPQGSGPCCDYHYLGQEKDVQLPITGLFAAQWRKQSCTLK